MAICKFCDEEMSGDTPANTCSGNTKELNVNPRTGKKHEPVSYEGEEDDQRCHDCNVISGGLHHPGCDWERCPICHGQIISCGCFLDE